jgi:hypothetical protein
MAKLLKKNMPRRKLRHGVGAVFEVLLKNLHSRPIVANKFPNALTSDCLDGLLCIICIKLKFKDASYN